MNKVVALLFLASLSTALACPVKKGYIANGLIKNTYSTEVLAPNCGTLRDSAARGVFSSMKWTELYDVKNKNDGRLRVSAIQNLLKLKGYKEISSYPTDSGRLWRFDKGSTIIIMMALAVADYPSMNIFISGN